jgi:hypothetical protein
LGYFQILGLGLGFILGDFFPQTRPVTLEKTEETPPSAGSAAIGNQ